MAGAVKVLPALIRGQCGEGDVNSSPVIASNGCADFVAANNTLTVC